MSEYDYIIYTRGFYNEGTGEGKWIALITQEKKVIKTLVGKNEKSNEARIKLVAIANSLYKIESNSKVLLLCDSQYATNSIIRGWFKNWERKNWKTNQGTVVQNRDIWQYLIEIISKLDLDIRWYQDYEGTSLGNRMKIMVNKI